MRWCCGCGPRTSARWRACLQRHRGYGSPGKWGGWSRRRCRRAGVPLRAWPIPSICRDNASWASISGWGGFAFGSSRRARRWLRLRGGGHGRPRSEARTLAQPRSLDLLFGDMLRGMCLAHVLIAGRVLYDQHIAEPHRTVRCRADPAGDVVVLVAPERCELAVLLLEVRHLFTDVGPGIGAFPDCRDLRLGGFVAHQGAPVFPQTRPKARQFDRRGVRGCRRRWLGI